MLLRALVVLLLVMNAGVALWWALQPTPVPPETLPATDSAVPALVLLSERDLPEAPEPPEAEFVGPPDPEDLPPLRQCLEVGPFLTQLDLRRATRALTPVANKLQFREARAVIRRGYRVFLPSLGSRDAALARARELAAKGLRDYYVVTAGDEQNTISLGLYRDETNARKRQTEVRALGIEASLEPRNEELPQFWLDLDVPPGLDWRAHLGGYSGVGSREIPCA